MPDDLRHFGCRRRVAAALGADDAVDDGHADAGEVAELHAVEDVLAGGEIFDSNLSNFHYRSFAIATRPH